MSELSPLTGKLIDAFVALNKRLPTGAELKEIESTSAEAAAVEPTVDVATGLPIRPPAVAIEESVFPDYIVCLEDGEKYKSLKRHLRTAHGLTPAQYRTRWGLSKDYPLVAPNYSASRSQIAIERGLGRRAA